MGAGAGDQRLGRNRPVVAGDCVCRLFAVDRQRKGRIPGLFERFPVEVLQAGFKFGGNLTAGKLETC